MNNPTLPEQVVQAIRAVVGAAPAMLHKPSFKGNKWLYLKECLDSTFVSSVGKFVDRFELDLANFKGAKNAVAVVNGTVALHVALKVAGVTTGDEVLIPALTLSLPLMMSPIATRCPTFWIAKNKHWVSMPASCATTSHAARNNVTASVSIAERGE